MHVPIIHTDHITKNIINVVIENFQNSNQVSSFQSALHYLHGAMLTSSVKASTAYMYASPPRCYAYQLRKGKYNIHVCISSTLLCLPAL